jgi:hypothetical protein
MTRLFVTLLAYRERGVRNRRAGKTGGSTLHYVLDLWFDQVVKLRLKGEAFLARYIDDFVVCFQYRADALRMQNALRKRLGKFGLALEPAKTKLVEFGRFTQRHASKRGRKRPETVNFLGFTLY